MSLPTENEINERAGRSLNEGICGIVHCLKNPNKKCKKCKNYYCSDHFPPHLDLMLDGETEYSSLNEGLGLYID